MLRGAFAIFCQIVVVFVVYVLGRYNFSVGWLVPFVVSTIRDYSLRKREVSQAAMSATSSMNERDVIFSRLDDIPAWVIFPDVERVEWINTIVKLLWPMINDLVVKLVKEFEPKINKKDHLESFKFQNISLGKIAPRITGIKVYEKNVLQDEIIAELNISYFGDCEFTFSLKGVNGGIQNIQLEGTLRIVLKQLTSIPPLVGEVELYFIKCPKFDFELMTLLAPLDMFALGDLLRTIINEELTSRLVFPNKICINLKEPRDNKLPLMPKLEGVVRAVIEDIVELDEFEGQEMCATIGLGSQTVESHKLMIKDGIAKVNFECHLATSDDIELRILVKIISNEAGEEVKLKEAIDVTKLSRLGKVVGNYPLRPSGSVSLTLFWLEVSNDSKDLQVAPENISALLEVYIDSARKLSKFQSFVFVELSIDNKTQATSSVDTKSSSWKQHFKFFIIDAKSESLKVKIIDPATSSSIAQYTYNLTDLIPRKNMQHDLQAYPMSSGAQDCEVLMSLQLHALKTPPSIISL